MSDNTVDDILKSLIQEAMEDDFFLHFLFTSGMFTGLSASRFDDFFTDFTALIDHAYPELHPNLNKALAIHLQKSRVDEELLGSPPFNAHTQVVARLFSRSLLKEAFSSLPDDVYTMLVLMGLKILTESALTSSHILPEMNKASGQGYRVVYAGNFLDHLATQLRSKEVDWHVRTMLHPFMEKQNLSEEGKELVQASFRLSLCKCGLTTVALGLGMPGLMSALLQALPSFEEVQPGAQTLENALEKGSLAKILSTYPEALAQADNSLFEGLEDAPKAPLVTRFLDYYQLEENLKLKIHEIWPDVDAAKVAGQALEQFEIHVKDQVDEQTFRETLRLEVKNAMPKEVVIAREQLVSLVDGIPLTFENHPFRQYHSTVKDPSSELETLLMKSLRRQFDEEQSKRHTQIFMAALILDEENSLLSQMKTQYSTLVKLVDKKRLVDISLSQICRPFLDHYVFARLLSEPLFMWQKIFALSEVEEREEKQSFQLPPLSI